MSLTNISEENYQPHLLLVDQESACRVSSAKMLKKQGYQVVDVVNGYDALVHLKQCSPDVIVCDLSATLEEGIPFIEHISLSYPMLPLIALSQEEDPLDIAKALRLGARDFITKPYYGPSLSLVLDDLRRTTESIQLPDFTCQWFHLDAETALPNDQVPYWHLEHLKSHPAFAAHLLTALMPEHDCQQGQWHCSYQLMQSNEGLPLVFDYAWLVDGQFVFYLVDTASAEDEGIHLALLIRAMFHSFISTQQKMGFSLRTFVSTLNQVVNRMSQHQPIRAVFGLADMTDATFHLIPMGLHTQWVGSQEQISFRSTHSLGQRHQDKLSVYHSSIAEGGRWLFDQMQTGHFCLHISHH